MAFSSLRSLMGASSGGGGGGGGNPYAIFGYGNTGSVSSLTNKVDSSGVVATANVAVITFPDVISIACEADAEPIAFPVSE